MLSRSRGWWARCPWVSRAPVPALTAIWAILLTLGSLLLVTPSAAADPASKKSGEATAAKAGKQLAARNFRAAAEGYESAFKESSNPKYLFSAAGVWKRDGDSARAANAFARYLKAAPEKAPQRAAAKKELATLVPKLGQFEIKADGASLVIVDGVEWEPANASLLYVSPGPHLVEARFVDESVKASPTARAGAVEPVTLTKTEAPPPPPPSEAPTPVAVETPKPRDRNKPLPPLAVYIGGGVAVVAGGLSLLSGLDVQSQKDSFDKDPSQANLDAGKGKQLRTNVLLVLTGAAVVFTGVAAIWFVDWSDRRKGPNVKVGAGLGSILLRGSF
jgi:hypothetical protein